VWGANILEDARHSSVLYICKYFVGKTNTDIPHSTCTEPLRSSRNVMHLGQYNFCRVMVCFLVVYCCFVGLLDTHMFQFLSVHPAAISVIE
jgi:hypothetical protein